MCLDLQSEEGAEEGRGQGEGVENVASGGDALSVNNQEVRLVVGVPNADLTVRGLSNQSSRPNYSQDRAEHQAVEQAGTDDGALLQVLVGDEGHRGQVLLPAVEERHANDTDDLQSNDVSRLPAVRGQANDVERKQDKGEDEDNEKNSDNCAGSVSSDLAGGFRLGSVLSNWMQ